MGNAATLTLTGNADMTGLAAGYKKADALTTKFVEGANSKLGSIGKSLLGPLAALTGAAGIGAFFGNAVKSASSLAETVDKVGIVFGPAAAQVEAQAKSMADSFGLPKKEMLDAAASIGLIGKAAGQSQSEAGAMANRMARLAADASSFYEVPLDVALDKIKSALVGESEPIRSFGVLLNEAAVANEAMALGLSKSGKNLDEQTKVLARASLIQKGLADATGNLEQTQNSAANQFKRVGGTIQNLTAEIGTALLPTVQELMPAISGAVEGFARFARENQGVLVSSIRSVAGVMGDVLGLVGQLAPAFSAAFQVAGAAVKVVLAPVTLLVEGLKKTLEWAGLIDEKAQGRGKAPPLSPEAAATMETDARVFRSGLRGPDETSTVGAGSGLAGKIRAGLPARPTPKATAPAVEVATPEQAKGREEIEKTIKAMREERDIVGMTADAVALYKLRLAGATDAQLAEASALLTAKDAAQKMKKEQDDLAESAKRVREGLKTPIDKAQSDIDEATKLRDAGKLSDEEYKARLGQIKEDNTPKEKPSEERFSKAMEMGSAESYSAILKASGMTSGKDPEAQKQTELLRDLVKRIETLIGTTTANKPEKPKEPKVVKL